MTCKRKVKCASKSYFLQVRASPTKWPTKDARDRMLTLYALLGHWACCVTAALPVIYFKFPLDNIFEALEKLGMNMAKEWTNWIPPAQLSHLFP